MSEGQFTYDPKDFADEAWAEEYGAAFDDYISLRVEGVCREEAVIMAFEMIKYGARLHNVSDLGLAADTNPYVRKRFAPKLEESDPSKLWNGKRAINALLKLLESPATKDSVKVMCVDRLNVLLGITEMTDTGKQKLIDREMADFYARRVHQQFGAAPTGLPH